MDEPYRFYYRMCLFVTFMVLVPLSVVLLGFRVYKVFWVGEPAIYPDCDNLLLKMGKGLLFLSKLLIFLYPVALVVTMLVMETGGASGIPAAMFLVAAGLLIPVAVLLVEIAQIKHRKWKKEESSA